MVLVLFVLTLIALFSFLAMAIDLGLVAMARTQAQAAADAAAMAGARTLNGTTGNNYSSVSPDAIQSGTNNSILGQQVTSDQLAINIGRYTYNATTQQFEGQFPGPSTDELDLGASPGDGEHHESIGFFQDLQFHAGQHRHQIDGRPSPARYVHHQRLLGLDAVCEPDGRGAVRQSPLVEQRRQQLSHLGRYLEQFGVDASHVIHVPLRRGEHHPHDQRRPRPDREGFLQRRQWHGRVFCGLKSYATTPAGDVPLKTSKNTSSTYAQTLAQVLNIASPGNSTYDATYESSGYAAYSMTSGCWRYIQGPGY